MMKTTDITITVQETVLTDGSIAHDMVLTGPDGSVVLSGIGNHLHVTKTAQKISDIINADTVESCQVL